MTDTATMSAGDGQRPAEPVATVAGRNDRRTALAITATATAAWVVLLVWGEGSAAFTSYVAIWTIMMVAMMLPSAAPFLLLYRRGASGLAVGRVASGYLIVWALVGVVAWFLRGVAMTTPAAVVLTAAGVYQLTPAKRACLRQCRSPADFLVQHWRPSAFRLGVHHGLFCLGCCWALMAVLVVAGTMGMGWVLAIAAVVAVEKLLPRGELFARTTGVGLLALAFMEVMR